MAKERTLSCLRRVPFPCVARTGAPPAAESSDRTPRALCRRFAARAHDWAGTWFCANEVQGKTLVPTRRKEPKDAFFMSGLPSVGDWNEAITRKPLHHTFACTRFGASARRDDMRTSPGSCTPVVHHPSLRWWSQPLRATARVAPTKYLKRAYFQSSAKRIPPLSIHIQIPIFQIADSFVEYTDFFSMPLFFRNPFVYNDNIYLYE